MSTTAQKLYQVVGNPIAHSLSPEIHGAFAEQTGIPLRYEKNLVEPGEFNQAADLFSAQGGCGMNVTVPFKTDAFAYASARGGLDELARAAGAVNTLDFSDDTCQGYNTDGLGILRDMSERHGLTIGGANVLLLGAGGATRGVLLPLLKAGPQAVIIANRTLAKAQALVEEALPVARQCGVGLRAISLPQSASDVALWGSALPDPDAAPDSETIPRVVINATSLGLQESGVALPAHGAVVEDAFCYDMSYGSGARFARWAATQAVAQSVDGLGMLVEQAAESFAIWHGTRPATDDIFARLRKRIDA